MAATMLLLASSTVATCILLLTALLVQVQHSAGCVCVRANETHDRQLHEHQGHLEGGVTVYFNEATVQKFILTQ